MDETIEILKKIGVKEINKTTKISVNKIEDILEKRFSNIQRVRVVGFLKILEREYKVDLSHWLKEYDESFVVEADTTEEMPSLKAEHPTSNLYLDTQKQRDDLIEERKKQIISKKRFYILLVVVVVVLGGYFIIKSFYGHSDTQITTEPTQSTSIAQDDENQASAISKIQNQDDDNQKDITNTPSKATSSATSTSSTTSTSSVASSGPASTSPASNNEPKKQDIAPLKQTSSEASPTQKEATKPTQESSSAPSASISPLATDNSNAQEGEILVIPKKSLWVEVIDLDTNEKKQTIIQDEYPIKTGSDRLLISFGHGELTIQNNDERVDYDKSYPLRFLYTPKDGLKHIRYSKYLELSGQEQ